jgi:hypothetical protein
MLESIDRPHGDQVDRAAAAMATKVAMIERQTVIGLPGGKVPAGTGGAGTGGVRQDQVSKRVL